MPDRDDRTPPEDDSTETAFPPDRAPERIGPYKILQKIGEGGMGVVYLAEQEAPLRRRVALKLIKIGMDTKQVVARFEAERQALALMAHPNVATVFDAGSTTDGRPYFVMEYVKGVPITEHCDTHRLTTRERVELFIHVCEGVQHAHQKGVIHRDIKPSNILVELVDGKAVPKIIDFGVAKATAQRLTERTLFTEVGVLVGTPEYMSPEQASLTSQDIDTRSDVYSLGVLLYELLVGALPFDSRELRRAGFDEIRRRICEDDPVRPSRRLATLGDAVTGVAKNRHTDPGGLRRQLIGDLDWIVLKALDRSRSSRYPSVSEFGADARRFLSDEVVAAGPPRTSVMLRKFIRRNRAAVMVGTFLGVCVLGALVAVTFGLNERAFVAREARAQNLRLFLFEHTYNFDHRGEEFLFSVFGHSRSTALGPDTPAIQLVDDELNALRREQIDITTANPYRVEYFAWRIDALARHYESLQAYERAEPLFLEATEILSRLPPDHYRSLVASYLHLATHYEATARPELARDMRTKAAGANQAPTLYDAFPQPREIQWNDPRLDGIKREMEKLHDVVWQHPDAPKPARMHTMEPNGSLIQTWVSRLLLALVGIFGAGSVYFYLVAQQRRTALWASLACSIVFCLWMTLFIQNGFLAKRALSSAPVFSGVIVAANEPTPWEPPAACSLLMMGDDLQILIRSSEQYVFTKGGKSFLTLRVADDKLLVSAALVDGGGHTILRINENMFQADTVRSFRSEQRDAHSLVVLDLAGKEVLNVRYLSPRVIRLTGRFQLPGYATPVEVFAKDGMRFPDGSSVGSARMNMKEVPSAAALAF